MTQLYSYHDLMACVLRVSLHPDDTEQTFVLNLWSNGGQVIRQLIQELGMVPGFPL